MYIFGIFMHSYKFSNFINYILFLTIYIRITLTIFFLQLYYRLIQ